MTTTTPATAVDDFLVAITDGAVRPDLYAAGAVLDAVVPNWRLTAAGPAAIADEYGRWFAHPARIEQLRRRSTATGEVVEYTLHWIEDGVPHTGRHVHVLDLAPDGRIASDHVWCGGRWPADLVAQMDAG